jgi:predicted nucleotidyltransferase
MKRKKTADEEYEEMMNLPHTKTEQDLKEREAFREILRQKGQDTEIIEEIVITPADGIFWEKIGKFIDPDRRDPWAKKKKKK